MGEWRALLPMASRLSRSTDTLGVRTRYSYECRVFHCSLTRPWLGCRCSGWLRRRSGAAGPVLSISHVIPPRLFQTLNSQRWYCNVLRRSRKVTVWNYVRHYSVRSGGPAAAWAVPALVCREWSAVRGVWWAVCGAGLVHLGRSPRVSSHGVPQPLSLHHFRT